MKLSKLKNSPMSTVPDDIVADILLRLPIKSLLRLRCVSNPWRNLISSPNFAKMHLKRTSKLNAEIDNHKVLVSSWSQFTSMNYNPSPVHPLEDNLELHFPTLTEKKDNIRILGSCNGLIFIRVGLQTIIIWNPSTRFFKRLLKPEYFRKRFVFGGFGFDSSVDDYKVVLGCTKLDSGNDPNKVEVFTMIPKLSSTWRKVQDIGCPDFKYEAGTFANGALHWLQQDDGAIMSFDLAEEKFGEFVTLPDSLARKKIDVDYMELGVLQGCLCLYAHIDKDKDDEVWVMKEYGVKSSWNKLFSILYSVVSFESYARPLCILKSGEVLMDVDGCVLVTYSPKDKTCKAIRGFPKWFETVAYVESLVSLNR